MELGTLRRAGYRLWADVRMGHRAGEYRSILEAATERGFRLVSVGELWAVSQRRSSTADEKLLALRHDVDIADRKGNELFFRVERGLGARATYYFRLSTVASHGALVNALLTGGNEVGYHYEEAATVAKLRAVRSAEDLTPFRDEIADRFRMNVLRFRSRWNPELRSVCPHGDWINRRLGVGNGSFVDRELLEACDLDYDATDPRLLAGSGVYISDVAPPPARWKADYGPLDALAQGRQRIYLLTHERQWHGAPIAKGIANVARLADEVGYRMRLLEV